jgi:metal-responsive CopG/Arc/MetJ family transcriptional regulator
VRIPEDILARVDAYAKRNPTDTRGRALRRLIARGLEAESQ